MQSQTFKFSEEEIRETRFNDNMSKRRHVMYSDHCSLQELSDDEQFVLTSRTNLVNPTKSATKKSGKTSKSSK